MSKFFSFPQFLLFLICCAFQALRASAFRPLSEPWAEDGSDLLMGALDTNTHLLTPIYDTPVLLLRIITHIAIAIGGLEHAPILMAVISIVIASIVSSYIARESYSWLISPLWLRLLMGLYICVGSGTLEAVGNAIYLTYWFGLFLILMALERPTLKPIILVPLAGSLIFSTAFSFLACPILMARLIFEKNRSLIILFILCLAGLLIPLVASWVCRTGIVALSEIRFLELLIEYVTILPNLLFLNPIIGRYLFVVLENQSLYVGLLSFCVVVFIYGLRKASLPVAVLTIGLILAFVGYDISRLVVRSQFSVGLDSITYYDALSRRNVIAGNLMMLTWVILLVSYVERYVLIRKDLFISILIFPVIICHPIVTNQFNPYLPQLNWRIFAREFTTLLNPESKVSAPKKVHATIGPLFPSSSELAPWALIECQQMNEDITCSILGGITGDLIEIKVR